MKSIALSLFFIAILTLRITPAARAQKDAEANNLARQGAQAAKDGDWDRAIENFRKATEMEKKHGPNLAAALQQRASAEVQQQQYAEAVRDYSEAIRVKNNEAAIYERRAYARMKMGEQDAALADYNEAIKLDPGEVRYYSIRSYIYEVKGDYKKSMADTEKVLKSDKNNADALSRKQRLEKIEQMAAQQQATTVGATPIPKPSSTASATATPGSKKKKRH